MHSPYRGAARICMYQLNVFRGLTGKHIDRSLKKNLKIPKGVIRFRKSKDRQRSGQKKKDHRTNTTNETKEHNTNPTKTGGELGCSGRVAVPAPLVAT
jgi:hypothetical protein